MLARAAVAVGVAGVFIETHEDPDNAPSDGPNMVPIDEMPALIEQLMAIDRIAKADAARQTLLLDDPLDPPVGDEPHHGDDDVERHRNPRPRRTRRQSPPT